MRLPHLLSIAVLALAGTAVSAQEPEKPVTDKSVSAADVATTPVTDLNLKKDEIPPILLAAEERPYDVAGRGRCPQIAAAIGELDAVLGPDLDVSEPGKEGVTAGRVAKSVVGSFIPFRGLIREISGANAQERKLQSAINAGIARRSFLKGYGQARGCRYPARAAATVVAANTPARTPEPEENKGTVQFVSQPVIQRVD